MRKKEEALTGKAEWHIDLGFKYQAGRFTDNGLPLDVRGGFQGTKLSTRH